MSNPSLYSFTGHTRKGSLESPLTRLLCFHLSVSAVMSQQLLILEMFIITLVTRLLYRREYDPLPEEEDINENTKMITMSQSA